MAELFKTSLFSGIKTIEASGSATATREVKDLISSASPEHQRLYRRFQGKPNCEIIVMAAERVKQARRNIATTSQGGEVLQRMPVPTSLKPVPRRIHRVYR